MQPLARSGPRIEWGAFRTRGNLELESEANGCEEVVEKV